jgi:hypothetical protein
MGEWMPPLTTSTLLQQDASAIFPLKHTKATPSDALMIGVIVNVAAEGD